MIGWSRSPVASVVFRVKARSPWTREALDSIEKHTRVSYELIFVSKDSPSRDVRRALAELPYVVVHQTADDSFAPASNCGAVLARSNNLVFIHGDTLVQDDWLEPLLEALETHPDAMCVAPRVLNPEGRLQNAGLMLARTAESVALGCGDDPDSATWNFVRDAQSPSSCCLAVRRSAFSAAGGFDPTFRGSDALTVADLALTFWARGWRTLYEPSCTVRQVADRCGRETSEVPFAPCSEAFKQRWRMTLARMPPPPAGRLAGRRLLEGRDWRAVDRILVIDDRVPHFDRGGGDPRMAALLMELVDLWPSARITFFAMCGASGQLYAPRFRRAGIEIVYGEDLAGWLQARAYYYSVVMISRPQPVIDLVRQTQPQARLVYDMEAIHFRRYQRMMPVAQGAGLANRWPLIAELRRTTEECGALEFRLIAAADAVLCVSADDQTFVRAVSPTTPSLVVSHVVHPVRDAPGHAARRDIIFFGGFMAGPNSPNEDAVQYLARQIMPIVWYTDPAIRLVIVGADPTDSVKALASDRIDVIGYVADPNEWLNRVRVHVMPARFGSGIKLKLLDTMSAGLPFVTTAVGAEGLMLDSLFPLVVADRPTEIAKRTLAIYHDRALWTEIGRSLQELAAERYGPDAFRRSLIDAMVTVGMGPSRSGRPAADAH